MEGDGKEEIVETTASLGVWIGLIAIAAASFWCLAIVTEERFVPALNVISTVLHIPDDVAGATLMAAGASCPALFSSIVALFVTHSSLGLGTVYGSEVFNQLIICAGAVYSSSTGRLELNKATVTRDVFFYALGITALYIALQDERPADTDPSGFNHIFVSFGQAWLVFGGYFLYVVVCANMDLIRNFRSVNNTHTEQEESPSSDPLSSSEINSNFEMTRSNPASGLVPQCSSTTTEDHGDGNNDNSASFERSSSSMVAHGLLRMVRRFSDVATLRPLRVVSVPDRSQYECHRTQDTPSFTEVVEDQQLHVMESNCADGNNKQPSLYSLAPSKEEMLEQVAEQSSPHSNIYQQQEQQGTKKTEIDREHHTEADTLSSKQSDIKCDELASHQVHDFVSLIHFPRDRTVFEMTMFVLLFPLRLAMHWTIPDVRSSDAQGNQNSSMGTATLVCVMCLVWLVAGSYAMVSSLEDLAELMNIPSAVIGYTVSAAGTSIPNYVGSVVAARNGLGNMAISNALGSNTFNIMIGLGMPWVLYTTFGAHFEPYIEMRDEGITEGVLIMAAVLLLLVLLLLQSSFVLYVWHGHLFVFTYIAYLIYIIGGVYWW